MTLPRGRYGMCRTDLARPLVEVNGLESNAMRIGLESRVFMDAHA